MAVIPIEAPPSRRAPPTGTAILALGFRPFFLLAGLGAVVLVALWMLAWMGHLPSAGAYYGTVGWHGHEMLFGYAGAVIAGFLLTAVRNWTGIDTPAGAPLAGLSLLWIAGRASPFLPVPGAVTAALDLAFLPLVAIALYRPLMAGKNRLNRLFLPLLGAMAAANAMVHAEALGLASGSAARGILAMLDLVLLLVLIVTGRVEGIFKIAECLEIHGTGWVEGEVEVGSLVVDEGGTLQGSCTRRGAHKSKEGEASKPKAADKATEDRFADRAVPGPTPAASPTSTGSFEPAFGKSYDGKPKS